ncbi:MAG: glycerol-3-phosphate 1-O-acyltransferase PlsY [Planctomycetota bacterium]
MAVTHALALLVAYAIGSIPFGYLVGRVHGIDIRKAGSGNIGATNVGRVLGRRHGMLVFALDLAKGALPVALTRHGAWATAAPSIAHVPLALLVAVMAVLGHMFPFTLGFKGGKGVATSLGAFLMLMPVPAIAALLIWFACAFAWHYVSLASIVASWSIPVLLIVSARSAAWRDRAALLIASALLALLVTIRHRANIKRLLRGVEPQAAWTLRKRTTGGSA